MWRRSVREQRTGGTPNSCQPAPGNRGGRIRTRPYLVPCLARGSTAAWRATGLATDRFETRRRTATSHGRVARASRWPGVRAKLRHERLCFRYVADLDQGAAARSRSPSITSRRTRFACACSGSHVRANVSEPRRRIISPDTAGSAIVKRAASAVRHGSIRPVVAARRERA
jgi:hypothetical protein